MNFDLLISLLLFILGCTFGSFLSVLIYRTLHSQSGIIAGKSRCPKCKHSLAAWDLIPVISWLYKGGRCSYCKKPISFIYPSLELVCGLLFLTNYNMLTANPSFAFFSNYLFDWVFAVKLLFLSLIVLNLIAIFFSDIQKKAIPNLFLYSWVLISAFSFLLTGPDLLSNFYSRCLALALSLFIFGGQYFFSKGKWLGSGDIYVAVGMAFLLGFNNLIVAIIFSYLTGSLISICLLLMQKVKFRQTVPFAPFLILGTVIALYHGQEIANWYLHLSLII